MFELFDKVVCIHLDHRADRLEMITKQFDGLGIKAEIFPAIFNEQVPMQGFNDSVLAVLNQYKVYDKVLVLEDDVEFTGPVLKFDKVFCELPPDWDLLYLGANVQEDLQKYSTHLYRLRNAWTTHAVAYSKKAMEEISQTFKSQCIYDEWLRTEYQDSHQCFITAPMMAKQWPSFSDIFGRDASYTSILESQKYFK